MPMKLVEGIMQYDFVFYKILRLLLFINASRDIIIHEFYLNLVKPPR